jgi:hypothetical protein
MVDELPDEGRWEVRKLHLERSNWVGADKERAGMLAQPDGPPDRPPALPSDPTESTPLACVVRGKSCQSDSEWRQLLKPFMED